LAGVDVSVFAAGGLVAAGLAGGFGAFDDAAVPAADFAGAGDFNGFDDALCEAFELFRSVSLVVFLLALPAACRRAFETGFFADDADFARAALGGVRLEDFLRGFLDIRLPFVAFGGSIMGVLRVLSQRAGIGLAAGQV
jgi:hypothetical protein